jgi:hypothetical protein
LVTTGVLFWLLAVSLCVCAQAAMASAHKASPARESVRVCMDVSPRTVRTYGDDVSKLAL